MSETIVVLKSRDLVTEFETLLDEQGLVASRIKGLPRFFVFADMTPDAFPLRDYVGIETIESGDTPLHPEANQPQATPMTEQMAGGYNTIEHGGWAPARIIRRKSPWRAPNHTTAAEATFPCLRTGVGVDVFMIDSGCYVSHDQFEGRAQQPWMYDGVLDTPLDGTGHGTACLSAVGGRTFGVAREVQMYSYKFHGSGEGVSSVAFITAMGAIKDDYEQNAASNRPGVLFCSWGGFGSTINAAITDCIDVGLPCCFPAGNSILDLDQVQMFPAEGDPDAIICGGLNVRDRPYYTFDGWGTSFGSPIDVVSPGQDVVVAMRPEDGGYYASIGSGTSYSTPYVVGVLACMLEGYDRLSTRAEVRALKDKLKANATRGELQRGYAPGSVVPDPSDPDNEIHRMADHILYLDPTIAFEEIPGLTPSS